MCLGEKPPGQDSDAEGADPPVAAGGEDEGGPFKGVLDFVLQPVTMPLAASVGSVFAGSLVMTLSIGFVLVHWAFSPPSPGGTALGGTPPPGIVQEQARQTTLSQKSVLFEEILRDISDAYVDKVNPEKLFETGVRAMLGSLDPYTEFENEEGNENLEITIMGGYGGVGLGVSEDWRITEKGQERDPTRFRVANAMEGYAYDAGLRPGDHLTAVDGKELSGKKIEDVTQLLRGKPGSPVTVSFQRDGDVKGDQRSAKLTRQVVRLRDVPLALMLEPQGDGIGYIVLRGFAADAGKEVKAALEVLKAQAPGGQLKSVILDMRGNPGGLLTQAVEVAEQFLPKGATIVGTEGRNGPLGGYTSGTDPTVGPDTRVVVLTDGFTASAAEIVTGAIQDHDRGVVVGERTFGKGLVQEVLGLPFKSSLKFTVARYLTPSGRCIQSTEYTSDGREKVKVADKTSDKTGAADKNADKGADKDLDADADDSDGAYRATRIKDQDRKVFKTDKGRIVRSGGGVEPDVPIRPEEATEIEFQLEDQNAFTNFAASYALKHPDVINERTMWKDSDIVNDQVYEEFMAFVSDKPNSGFERRTRFDSAIDQIGGALVADGFSTEVQAEAGKLKSMVQKQLGEDLLRHKRAISVAVEDALRQRVEPEKIRLAHRINHDRVLNRAVKLASSPEYAELLQAGRTIAIPDKPSQVEAPSVRTALNSDRTSSVE